MQGVVGDPAWGHIVCAREYSNDSIEYDGKAGGNPTRENTGDDVLLPPS